MELPERHIESVQKTAIVSKDVKKHIERVRNAGQWARTLGWLALFTIPLSAIIQDGNDHYATVVVYVIAVPMIIFLLISGKYIQFFGSKHVVALLVSNSIISVLGIGGILPIITTVTSLMGVVSYNRLNKLDKVPKFDRTKSRISVKEIIAIILLVAAGVTALIYAYGSSSTSSNSGSVLMEDASMTEYNSVEHGFKVDFPGFPETERQDIKEGEYTIPYTTYTKDTDNGQVAYIVAVEDFTGIEIDSKGALEGFINGAVQNSKAANLITSGFSTFLGYESVDAYYTVPYGSETFEGYIKAFIKDNKMYAMLSIGASEADFKTFTTSFEIN